VSELANSDPWSDEVCEAWLDDYDKRANEALRTGSFTKFFLNTKDSCPEAVLAYEYREIARRVRVIDDEISAIATRGIEDIITMLGER